MKKTHSSTTGFTLIEFLVLIFVLGTILIFILGTISIGSSGLWMNLSGGLKRANGNLIVYSQQAGLTPMSCVGQDTDGNKYVACSAKNPKSDQIVKVECAYGWFTSGCKLPDFAIPVQGSSY